VRYQIIYAAQGFFFLCLNTVGIIHRARSFEQVATVSTFDIKGIPGNLIVIELNEGTKDATATDALVCRAYSP